MDKLKELATELISAREALVKVLRGIDINLGKIILFRGIEKNNGKWIRGSLIGLDGVYYICDSSHDQLVIEEVVTETVGQYTNLASVSLGDMFDGDTIRIHSEDNEYFDGVIFWYDGAWMVKFDSGEKDWLFEYTGNRDYWIEVIGSIHDKN